MSRWNHVVGTLYVETYREENNIEEFVKNILKNAPVISGSESNCNIFVNALSGYNSSTSSDCRNCIYKDTIKKDENGFSCDAKDDYVCPSGKYQSCVAITLVGDLRDKTPDETKSEIKEFIKFLQEDKEDISGFSVEYCSLCVYDDYSGINYTMKIQKDRNNIMDKGVLVWTGVK